MSQIDRISQTGSSGLPPGLLKDVAAFVCTALAVNAMIFWLGLNNGAGGVGRISWAPPGWAIGAIWVALFAFYGVAHRLLRQHGGSGRSAAKWVLAITAWDLAYPFLTNGFDIQIAAWLNLLTVVFTIALLWRVWREPRPAFTWLLPSLVWICFATVLTFAAMPSVG